MKRSPLKRSKPMRHTKASSYARRDRAPTEWFAWVKSQPCILRLAMLQLCENRNADAGVQLAYRGKAHRCDGPIEADHAGPRAFSRKAPDATCIPLCMAGHRERTDYRGAFIGFDAATMREWCDIAIHLTQSRAWMHGIPVPTC